MHYKRYILLILLSLSLISMLGAITPYVSNQIFYADVLKEGGRYYGKILNIILVMIAVRVASLLIACSIVQFRQRYRLKLHMISEKIFSRL